jgi:L,D-transpeptidase YbiS
LSANFATGYSFERLDPSGQERSEPDSIQRALRRLEPRGTYVVIDRSNNVLWVRRSGEVLREAVVSTGSGTVLRETSGQQREWVFDTPAGAHTILDERRNPVWVKPDWAFLEEGRQPPTLTRERIEAGSLGEWALDLGDGYMIHGTLYERLLGRPITHGCIRVGRDDLRFIAAAVRPGTPVYIF